MGFVVLWASLCDHHVCFHDRGFSVYVCVCMTTNLRVASCPSPVCASCRALLRFLLGVQYVSSVCDNVSLRLVFGVPVVFVVECYYFGCDAAMAILFW